MSGARIQFDLRDKVALAALRRLQRLGVGGQPLMRAIGTALAEETVARFRSGEDPEGRPWAPLNTAYASIKRGPGILRESQMLMRSITYVAGTREVAVGSNRVYAAIQQFGGVIRPKNAKALVFRLDHGLVRAKRVTIPARPYLGFGNADQRAVIETLDGIVEGLLRP